MTERLHFLSSFLYSLEYYSFIVNLEIKVAKFFFFKAVLDILGPLHIPIHFRISLPSSIKFYLDFDWNRIESKD